MERVFNMTRSCSFSIDNRGLAEADLFTEHVLSVVK